MAVERASKLTSLAVVAVFAGTAAGAWALWGPQLPASAWNQPPTGEAGRLAADPMVLALGDFGAGTEHYDHVRSFDDVVDLKFMNPAEIDVYRAEGAGAARITVTSRHPDGRVLVTVIRMADRAAALRTADAVDELQLGFGFVRVPEVGGVTRLLSTVENPQADPPPRPTARAHYVHDDMVVRVQLDGVSFDALTHFEAILSAQLEALSADG
ncbi:MAG: hypothetical protein HOY78_48300 [Saccharothrix sp.]|nr:hypothetical protein [Saccharothrix sp.]